ncbi:helix-turn-helix domain-containing protein [Halalkalicoccus jeotgali]|uniref:DNA binding domain-containing protein n=1 Tax=Halalkalicoccus jeotgali (strain DSM 18796 / CECT 7217 / JCM 14584 / KCTC 4019 / B3) TaxID=795797 RepID=D8J3B6_HALJB|nr:multiprotein-bridging factor 1 family protein [Halalkalicoccus jeotgali]ADJ15223.1 DNA binding domain-containing protein [Halalkalicoccus jeotgali B3]ELY35200.1 DNA binding domain-containing protein [Halalkalicoccus jeotgali B3]
MAKYSTGGSSDGGDGGSCELCGESTGSLKTATIAGATLQVCSACAPHDDAPKKRDERSKERDRKQRAARKIAEIQDSQGGDSSRWEREGTNYADDPLPYLVSGYGDRLKEARQDAGLQVHELAESLDVPEEQLMAVEQGRAARAGVGGSLIADLESELDIELAE